MERELHFLFKWVDVFCSSCAELHSTDVWQIWLHQQMFPSAKTFPHVGVAVMQCLCLHVSGCANVAMEN